MIRRLVLSVDFEESKDLALYRKFIATWNEHHETLYKNGALVIDVDSPVEESFLKAVNLFSRGEGTSFTISRRIDVKFEKADIDRADWLLLNINGFAGAGARELAPGIYEEHRCPECGFRDNIRQLSPLVVLKAELKKKDFLHTSHLETLVSDRARDFLCKHCSDNVTVRPIDILSRSGSRRKLEGYGQLCLKVTAGRFSASMTLQLGEKCGTCGRETSRVTRGSPQVVDRKTLPEVSIFRLDEGLGSSCRIPPRSNPTVISKKLFQLLKTESLKGYYVTPLLLE